MFYLLMEAMLPLLDFLFCGGNLRFGIVGNVIEMCVYRFDLVNVRHTAWGEHDYINIINVFMQLQEKALMGGLF